MTINMSKSALVVKHRNATSLRPDEHSIAIEHKRPFGEKLA
jgi:hypothetical protein